MEEGRGGARQCSLEGKVKDNLQGRAGAGCILVFPKVVP